jgi:translation elongation factor EF-1alpha
MAILAKQKKMGGDRMPEEEIGKVSTFFARPVVAGIDLTSSLKVGDTIHIQGHTTDIEVEVESMQIDNVDVKQADSGDSVGVKVTDRVRPGDHVYKLI